MESQVLTGRPIQVDEKEAARLTGVSTRTLFNERQAGRLKFGRVGIKVVYRLTDLDEWSKSNIVANPAK